MRKIPQHQRGQTNFAPDVEAAGELVATDHPDCEPIRIVINTSHIGLHECFETDTKLRSLLYISEVNRTKGRTFSSLPRMINIGIYA